MSRGLPAVLAALFLALSLGASAQNGPDDYFDAAKDGAFAPGQREFILGLDSGRYAVNDGRLFDGRTHKALTNAQVAELLKGPAQATATGGSAADPRGDAAAARARAITAAGGKPGTTNYDGSVDRPDLAGGPGPANGGRAPASDPAVLQSQLLTRLVFKGTTQEKALMSEAIGNILKTKIGRELAAQFVAEQANAEIGFEKMAGSATVDKDGRKVLSGSPGNTDVQKIPPQVRLNSEYLNVSDDYRRVTMTGTLAHELFGHAFETQRARKLGLPFAVNYYYRGDEVGSELIDWTVQTELAGEVVDGDPAPYLADPEKYHRGLWTNQPYYVVILSPAEMRDPLKALRARRQVLVKDRAQSLVDQRSMAKWPGVIDHFIKVHGIVASRFKPAIEESVRYDTYIKDHIATLKEISDYLDHQIAQWSAASGAKELAQVKAGADSAYLAMAEKRLAARRTELLRLQAEQKASRGPASAPPMALPDLVKPVPNDPNPPISLDDVVEMYSKDKDEHPEHWKK